MDVRDCHQLGVYVYRDKENLYRTKDFGGDKSRFVLYYRPICY